MHHKNILWVSMLALGLSTTTYAQDALNANDKESLNNSLSIEENQTTDSLDNVVVDAENIATDNNEQDETSRYPRLEALKELKSIKIDQLKVNANAAQADEVKDPLQPLNRQIYEFNDVLDRNIARPLAVQYTKKVPTDVRGSYRSFRKNLGEPWNAVNQLAQGRFSRAAKTLGRFTLNTVTTLGFADPATRLGMSTEEEDLGTTLGYYGVPSGPYLMLPVMGPSTFRDSLGRVVDSQARPQKYILENNDRLYYSEQVLRGVDARSQLLDVEQVLQGDKYAALRDVYLQRKNFEIAEKKGIESSEGLFIEDDLGDDDTVTE